MKTNGKVTVMVAALIAVAMSGTALAKHEEGHDNGQGPGPKASVNVTNTCTVVADDCTNCRPDHILRVSTEIVDVSGDPPGAGALPVESKTVKGLQRIENPDKGKKVIWTYVGAVEPSDTIPNPVDVHLCQMPTLNGAKALNAEVTVEVGGRVFYSQCDDDPDTFCGYDEDGAKIICEEKDESIVLPVDDNGDPISCDLR